MTCVHVGAGMVAWRCLAVGFVLQVKALELGAVKSPLRTEMVSLELLRCACFAPCCCSCWAAVKSLPEVDAALVTVCSLWISSNLTASQLVQWRNRGALQITAVLTCRRTECMYLHHSSADMHISRHRKSLLARSHQLALAQLHLQLLSPKRHHKLQIHLKCRVSSTPSVWCMQVIAL